jgi:hypothetical protein
MEKKIKAYLGHFVPPILIPSHFREIYNRIIHKEKINHHFEFENKFFKRHAFINKAISKFKDCKYLEIGVGNNDVFNSIPLKIENKFGVDPKSGGNYRMTSDNFFKEYSHLKFDVIFIDGLHEHKQCQKDCLNSMRQLNDNGIIFFHDFLPRSFFEEKIPRKQSAWTGDVWKVVVELANSKNVEFKIINIDSGISVLKLKKNFEYKKLDELKEKSFKEYLEYKKNLPIITSELGLDFIMEQ